MSRFEGFTPGPWKRQGDNIGIVCTNDDFHQEFEMMVSLVASVEKYDLPAEWEKNAELIAAAPDLLAENERLRGMCEEGDRVYHKPSGMVLLCNGYGFNKIAEPDICDD